MFLTGRVCHGSDQSCGCCCWCTYTLRSCARCREENFIQGKLTDYLAFLSGRNLFVILQLLETADAAEKMHQLDRNIAVAVAGINSDANILINSARYSDELTCFVIKVFSWHFLAGFLHNVLHLVTQNPFLSNSSYNTYAIRSRDTLSSEVFVLLAFLFYSEGGQFQFFDIPTHIIIFLYFFWKKNRDKSCGFQLYQSDPSGNYAGWMVRSTPIPHFRDDWLCFGDCALNWNILFD